MADTKTTGVDTSIYANIGKGQQPMTPLEILQMIGAANQNKLFNQTYNAREAIGNAYRNNTGPNGIDAAGLVRDIGQGGGFLAGEATGTALANAKSQFEQRTAQQQFLRQGFGALASNPNVTAADVYAFATNAVRAGIPIDTVMPLLDGVSGQKSPKAIRQYLISQGVLALGPDALKPAKGSPDEEGRIPEITEGEAISRRAGVAGAPSAGGFVTTNPPGFEESAKVSAQEMAAARSRGGDYAADMYPMTEALGALERLGPSGTGPGTAQLNTVKSFIRSNLSWLPGTEKLDPDQIKDFDKAEKYLTAMVSRAGAGFGHGTDQQLATALKSSPNVNISNLAAVDLMKAGIALRNMEQARILQAEREGVTPGRWQTWATQWASKVDPRAFMYHVMTPEQLGKLNKSMSPGERAKFNRSVKMAIDLGLIPAPEQ